MHLLVVPAKAGARLSLPALTPFGITVSVAGSLADVPETIHREQFDLVIVDASDGFWNENPLQQPPFDIQALGLPIALWTRQCTPHDTLDLLDAGYADVWSADCSTIELVAHLYELARQVRFKLSA